MAIGDVADQYSEELQSHLADLTEKIDGVDDLLSNLQQIPDMYVMLIDESTATAFDRGPVSWANDQEWRADGIDPSILPNGYIPMKRASGADLVGRDAPASKGFALAHRAGRVEGPPRWIISLTLSAECVVKHLFDGSLQVHHRIDTLAFKKQISQENYPGIANVEANPILPHVGNQLLQFGYGQIGV